MNGGCEWFASGKKFASVSVCHGVGLLFCYFVRLSVCLFMFMIYMIVDEWWVRVVCKWQKAAADEMKA